MWCKLQRGFLLLFGWHFISSWVTTHEQDVRAHARLARALAAAEEVERVGLARDARAGGRRRPHHDERAADFGNLVERVDPPRRDPCVASVARLQRISSYQRVSDRAYHHQFQMHIREYQ